MDNARLLNCQAISQSDYIVVAQSQQGKRQLQVALGNGMSCSCGRSAKYLLSCAHVVSAAQINSATLCPYSAQHGQKKDTCKHMRS